MKTVKIMGAIRVFKLMDVDTDKDQVAKTTAMNAAQGGPEGWNIDVNPNDGQIQPAGPFTCELVPYVEPTTPSEPVADEPAPEGGDTEPAGDDTDPDTE
jgi:hypothetical protein